MKHLAALILLLSLVFNLKAQQTNQKAVDPTGAYVGEYQWFINGNHDYWAWKIFRGELLLNTAKGNWKDKFHLETSIEVVSFPFLPDYDVNPTTQFVRNQRIPNQSEWDPNTEIWSPYNSSPIMFKKINHIVGSYKNATHSPLDTRFNGTTLNANRTQTIISKNFCK